MSRKPGRPVDNAFDCSIQYSCWASILFLESDTFLLVLVIWKLRWDGKEVSFFCNKSVQGREPISSGKRKASMFWIDFSVVQGPMSNAVLPFSQLLAWSLWKLLTFSGSTHPLLPCQNISIILKLRGNQFRSLPELFHHCT